MANPLAEAVLLIQRGFWWTTTTRRTSLLPADLWQRGFIMLGVFLVLLVFAQWVFTRLEGKVPELLT